MANLEEPHIVKQKVNPLEKFELMFGNFFNPMGEIKNEIKKNFVVSKSPLLYYYDGGSEL